jgi:hypothetical protein
MELRGIALGVQSLGSSWLLVLPLTSYRECVLCQRVDACLPTSGVALRSSFCLAPAPALALVGVGLVDGVEVGVQTDLAYMHRCVPICVVSVPFPGCTPNPKNSLPCLAASQDASHSSHHLDGW